MSMKSNLYMMLAMAGMFGSMPMGTGYSTSSQPMPKPRKLSPEEEAEELKKRQEKFLADLEKHNAERKQNFPNWKEYEVYGLKIIASKEKNARRDMNGLMRRNYIAIKTVNEQVPVQ